MGIHERVDAAVRKLQPACTMDAINAALAAAFTDNFRTVGQPVDPAAAATRYVDAVKVGFYDTARQTLHPSDRECALIALLASQDAEDNLALHLFIGLMAGLSARTIIDLLHLTGIYAGANVLTKSLRVAMKTFDAIVCVADAGQTAPGAVMGAILAGFPDPALDVARQRLRKMAE